MNFYFKKEINEREHVNLLLADLNNNEDSVIVPSLPITSIHSTSTINSAIKSPTSFTNLMILNNNNNNIDDNNINNK